MKFLIFSLARAFLRAFTASESLLSSRATKLTAKVESFSSSTRSPSLPGVRFNLAI